MFTTGFNTGPPSHGGGSTSPMMGGTPQPLSAPTPMMPTNPGMNPYPTPMPFSSPYPMSYNPNQPMIYNPTQPPLMFPGPMGTPFPPNNNMPYTQPPTNLSPVPSPQPEPLPAAIIEVKKGRLYVTLGSEGSQGFTCLLTSDGKIACFSSDKATGKPKETFTVTAKSSLSLDGGSLSITREDGKSMVMNAVSISAIKEWYDAIRDLQKDLKHFQRPLSSSAPGTPPSRQHLNPGGSQSHVRRNSAEVPMNYDSEVVPVPPRPKHVGKSPTVRITTEKSLSDPSLPTPDSPQSSPKAEAAKLPRPSHAKARLKRSTSMSSNAEQLININRTKTLSSLKEEGDRKQHEGGNAIQRKSPREKSEDDELRSKTQGSKPVDTSHETQSVAELLKQIHTLKVQNEQLEKAVEKLSGDKPAGGPKDSVQVAGVWSAITIDFRKDHVEYHERLGGGGSGATVFRCSVKGFSFAAKILSTQYHQPEEIEPLLREISIMTRLQHDNIVRYLGSEATTTEIRLFMELYSGTLRDVIESNVSQKRTFPKKDITNYVFQITKGLNYLHTQDPPIIHRDLKSDNIFVTWDGQRNPKTLRIGDFDTSKVMCSGKMAFTQNIGTPGFIAPEVFAKSQPTKEVGHDTHADIWSLGMIMYELITLKRPYFDMPFLQVSEANAQGSRPAIPDDVDREEYKDLIKLYEKCTRKIPSKRPTAKRLLSSLGAL